MNVARIGRWLLPWVLVLAVSATIAHAASDALERTLHEPPDPIALAAQNPCAGACPHWVEITSVNEHGARESFKCLVSEARYSGDALEVHFADLNDVVANMCKELWR